MKNDPKNYLKRNNTVRSIANSIKKDDMISIINNYPALKSEANSLINEFVNNGLESFNAKIGEIVRTNNQDRKELVTQIELTEQENSNEDILDRISQQMQSLIDNLTPKELNEFENRKTQSKINDKHKSQEEQK